MSIFASYFWLWSIIGLLGLLILYTLGSIMNVGGFISPLGRAGKWLDRAPVVVKAGIAVAILGLLAYPSLIHKLWADATAQEVRRAFEALPTFPGARPAAPTEQFSGLYDPTGTEGTYIIGWYGTTTGFGDVRAHFQRTLGERGWVAPEPEVTASRASPAARLEFRDHPEARAAHYEVLIAPVSAGSREIPAAISGEPTVYAVRLGVVDPRVTTQVAWFIDCLVRRAPTFPTCEATGWNPIEENTRLERPPGRGSLRP